MYLEALRTPQARGAATASSHSMSAPVGGWNARNAWQDMDESDAIIMDNVFPETNGVRWRRGHTAHLTGLGAAAESLMAWNGPSSSKLKVAANSAIYDATAAGAVGAAEVSSMTNDRWQHVNFETSGGNFLVCANGADAVRNYDGSSWTTPTLTGGTSANMIHVNAHKRRLWFTEVDTLSAWYLPVDVVTGTITEFPLGASAQLGGYLVAMATWTRDSGSGIDDLAVFITDRGELIIYQGTDPGSASTWALVGVFRIGEPIGRRCFFKIGSELVLITRDGYMPISRAIAASRTTQAAALSDKIRDAVNVATRDYGANFGWQPILYPRGNMALFNVPISATVAYQHVANTTTGAWCRFIGQNAFCWELFNDKLYFGAATAVNLADNGLADLSVNIAGEVKTAYSYFGNPGRLKLFKMVRPVFDTEGAIQWAMRASVDFDTLIPQDVSTYTGTTGSAWDTSPWDTSAWSQAPRTFREWRGLEGQGYAAALHVKAAIQGVSCRWYSTDWLYEPGSFV